MTKLLYHVLTVSINASLLIAAIVLLRLLFKKAPKTLHCTLWGLVALRLLLPFQIESRFSLQPDNSILESTVRNVFTMTENNLTAVPAASEDATIREWTTSSNIRSTDGVSASKVQTSQNTSFFSSIELPALFGLLWLSGSFLMLVYAILSLLRMKRRTTFSLPDSEGVYRIDSVKTPFLFGILHPVIYLPTDLTDTDKPYVLAHEQAHIRRKDGIWKAVAYFLLSVYWFNPLIWVAYAAFNHDLELACDETVIRAYSVADRAAYAEALLHCGHRSHSPALSPLAFGEISVKNRIRKTLSYKKPALWIVVLLVIAAAVVAVGLLTTPKNINSTGVEVISFDNDRILCRRVVCIQQNESAHDLDTAIHTALMQDNEDKTWIGEFQTEAHILLGTKEKKGSVTAYLLHSFDSFGFFNGYFMEQGGHTVPAVLTFSKTEDGYALQKLEYAQDGGQFTPSIKKLFPLPYRIRLQALLKTDLKELWEQVKQNAQAYLVTIGKTADVVTYGDIPHTLFTEIGMPTEISNNGLPPETGIFPQEIGSEERIENGIRYLYSTAFLTDKNVLMFTKAKADASDDILTLYYVDINTGKLIPEENFNPE